MYYTNNVIQSPDINITTYETYDNYNLGNINYNIGTNDYSSTTYNDVSPQNDNSIVYEVSNKYKELLKPRYNINSVNVNPFLRKNNPYGIGDVKGLMDYALTKSFNPIINSFNSYHIPKSTIQRANTANKILSTSNRLLNKNQSVYDAIINETISTQPTLHLINSQIFSNNDNYLQNTSINPSLIKSVQVPNASQLTNNLAWNNNLTKQNIQATKKRNLRYSVPVKMNPLFSLSTFQQKYSKDTKVEEIPSKIDEKEYLE